MGFFDLFKKKNKNNDKINLLQEPLKIALSILENKKNNAMRGILIDLNFDQSMHDKFLIASLIKGGAYNTWGQDFIQLLLKIVDSNRVDLDEVSHLHSYITGELEDLEKMKV